MEFTEQVAARKFNKQIAHGFLMSHNIQRIFADWAQRASMLRHKRIERTIADKVHARNLTRCCFHTWERRFVRRLQLRQAQLLIVRRCNARVLHDSLLGWRVVASIWQVERKAAQRCTSMINKRMLRDSFACWKKKYDERSVEKLNNAIGSKFMAEKLMRRVFKAWRGYTIIQRMQKAESIKGAAFHNRSVQRVAFLSWTRLYQQRKTKQQRKILAKQVHRLTRQKQVWTVWLHVLTIRKEKQRKVVERIALHNLRLERMVFSAWSRFHHMKQAVSTLRERSVASNNHRFYICYLTSMIY